MKKTNSKTLSTDFIKKLVEKLAVIDDISIKNREGSMPYYRFIYCQLCHDFRTYIPKYSLSKVGYTIDRNHATVIYAKKKFNDDLLKNHHVYKSATLSIREYLKILPVQRMKKEEVIQYYSNRHFELSEDYRSKLRELRERLRNFKYNKTLVEVSNLKGEELREAEIKMQAYLKLLKSRKHHKQASCYEARTLQ